MDIVQDLKYTKTHEWIKIDGGKAYIGITDYAQHHLGDIVFVELPETGDELNAGDTLGVVESVKAASDVYSPVSGTVTEVNEQLADNPGEVNSAPYESWFTVIELKDLSELDALLDAEAYEKLCIEED